MKATGDDATSDHVPVRPGLRFPRIIRATEEVWGPDGYRAEVEAVWEPQRLAYAVRVLKFEGGPEHPVTAAGLRRFSLQDLLRSIVRREVEEVSTVPSDEDVAALGRLRPDDPLGLELAARRYAISRACGDPPLKAVADAFEVSQSTATRVVARARELGLLD